VSDVNGTNRQLYRLAIRHWGQEAQIGMAIEECAELIAALQQYGRGRTTAEEVGGEIADVMIMCEQLRLIYGPERVDRAVTTKLQRLEERLEGEGVLVL
jgi:NTP pyrophosphatase (non-canonical NTP hydrolase)